MRGVNAFSWQGEWREENLGTRFLKTAAQRGREENTKPIEKAKLYQLLFLSRWAVLLAGNGSLVSQGVGVAAKSTHPSETWEGMKMRCL